MSEPAVAAQHAFRPDFADPGAVGAAVDSLRRTARSRFEDLGFPTRSDEEWRFTPLSPVLETPFRPAVPTAVDVGSWMIPGCRRLVFVNGRLDRDQSDLGGCANGISITTLAHAGVDSPSLIKAHLGKHAAFESNAITALNTAQAAEGAFVHLRHDAGLATPLQIIYAVTGPNSVTYPRALIVLEDGATLELIESVVGDEATLTCPVTEVALGAAAKLHHTRIQDVSGGAFHLGTLAATLDRESHYTLSSVSLGGRLSRLEITTALAGEGAHTAIDGLTLVDGRRVGDHQVRVGHDVPGCSSLQRFRSVLCDRSRAVFTGRILVAENAQGTDANQSSRSLVLSPEAVAFNNPQLEIYADDVRCTHGSTVGQLDEEALFYLRARGIGIKDGKRILTRAFAAEVLDAIRVDEVRSRLDDALSEFLDSRPNPS